jgi:hypothetical protein
MLEPAARLVELIENAGYEALPGPLRNRLEWQEIKRRLQEERRDGYSSSFFSPASASKNTYRRDGFARQEKPYRLGGIGGWRQAFWVHGGVPSPKAIPIALFQTGTNF